MKFMRRPDIDTVARVTIAVQAFLGLGVLVNHWIARFYQGLALVRLQTALAVAGALYIGSLRSLSAQAIRKEVDRYILLLRLGGIVRSKPSRKSSSSWDCLSLRWGIFRSIQRPTLTHCPTPRSQAQIVFLLCDEIFTLGQPILITVEPRSLAILKIELVDNREAETWKKHWEALADAERSSTQRWSPIRGRFGQRLCVDGADASPDLFHLLRPLALFGERFYRQALAAIAWEYERGSLEIGLIRSSDQHTDGGHIETGPKPRLG